MSLVDRWLARPLADRDAATSATSPKKASITAALEVASRVRLPATSAQATTGSPGVSRPVTLLHGSVGLSVLGRVASG
jgi:hypothetical protein